MAWGSGAKTAAYCYDGNGDLVAGDGRTVTWSAFGMPVEIARGLRAITLSYGPDRSRFRRVDTNETGATTTHYVAGGAFEATISAGGQVTHKATIASVAVVIDVEAAPGVHSVETRYLLKDHLGSLDVTTDASGVVLERLSFDAWGQRRNVDWTAYLPGTGYLWQGQAITRGFTFHEALDPVGLVHMNGRVYDPEIGRFLSADPVIQSLPRRRPGTPRIPRP